VGHHLITVPFPYLASFPLLFTFVVGSLFLTLGGVGVGWAPVSSGCIGAYNLRWVFKVKEKGS
jgi:hypothetical protein